MQNAVIDASLFVFPCVEVFPVEPLLLLTKHINQHHKGQTASSIDLLDPNVDPLIIKRQPEAKWKNSEQSEPSSHVFQPRHRFAEIKSHGGRDGGVAHHSHSRSWKLQKAIQYLKMPYGEKGRWLIRQKIPSSDITQFTNWGGQSLFKRNFTKVFVSNAISELTRGLKCHKTILGLLAISEIAFWSKEW